MIARDQHTTLCAAVETMCTSLNLLLVAAGCRYLMCAELCCSAAKLLLFTVVQSGRESARCSSKSPAVTSENMLAV